MVDPLIGRTLGRYQILAEIGRGGMGVVYRALDAKLHREVAIKVLPAELLADADRRHRFIREAQTASRIEHPHVGVIHEVDEADGVTFIAMELIRGEKLSDVLAQGAWTTSHAVAIAAEVAEGLARAHELGVVHRDIKPANVMITEDGHAKIVDFGLAKLVMALSGDAQETTAAGTDPGVVLGTTSYMSPEQARAGKIDHRSDIFSFGVLLYEMLARRRPFEGHSGVETLHAILHAPAPPLPPLGPDVSVEAGADLQRIVEKCLAKDPADRYQGLRDVVVDLRAARRRLESGPSATVSGATAATPAPITAVASATPSEAMTRRPRRLRYVLAATGVVIVAAAVYFGVVARPYAAILTDKDTILLADWENTTGDAVLDGTLKTALAVQLEQSPFLDLFSDQRVRETLGYMGRSPDEKVTKAIAREICERQGLKAFLAGSVSPLGSHYVLALEAIDAHTGEVLARQQEEAESKEQVLRAVGQAATKLRPKLGESLSTVQAYDVPIEQATTTSLEALQAFALARKLNLSGHYAEAIDPANRAIELDPNLAIAYGTLASTYANLGDWGRAAQFATKAFELRNRVSERERLTISAYYYQLATGETDKALGVAESLTRTYPRFAPGHHSLGNQYRASGQYEKAIAEYRRALDLYPIATTYVTLAGVFTSLNRFQDAKETCQQALANNLDLPQYHEGLYTIAVIQGDRAAMKQQLDWALAKTGEFRQFGWQADAAAFAGQGRQARAFSLQVVAAAERAQLNGDAVGYATSQAMTDAAFGDCERAKQGVAKGADLGKIDFSSGSAAVVLAACGDVARAAALADACAKQFPKVPVFRALLVPTARALIELRRHDPARAVELLAGAETKQSEYAGQYWPQYVRGEAYLALGKGPEAAAEFQAILDHRGWAPLSPLYPLAHLGLARAIALGGDAAKARKAYDEFFAAWKDADADLPILIEAKKEYDKLK